MASCARNLKFPDFPGPMSKVIINLNLFSYISRFYLVLACIPTQIELARLGGILPSHFISDDNLC